MSSSKNERICKIEKTAWDYFIRYISSFPRTEKSVLGIGYRTDSENVILCFCVLHQLHNSGVYCEFNTDDMANVLLILSNLRDKYVLNQTMGISAWVHTHPHLTPFYSGTDKNTFRNFILLDNNLMGLVVDPFCNRGLAIKTFRGHDGEIVENAWELFDDTATPKPLMKDYWEDFVSELRAVLASVARPFEFISTPLKSFFGATAVVPVIKENERIIVDDSSADLPFRSPIKKNDAADHSSNFLEISAVELLRKRRKSVGLALEKGEAYSFKILALRDLLRGSKDAPISRRTDFSSNFEVSVPSFDPVFQSTSLPTVLQTPLIKSECGFMTGLASGVRSALLFDNNYSRIFRLKGSGYNTSGFINRDGTYKTRKKYSELRGCQYQNTCLKEQIITALVNEILGKNNLRSGNTSLGWWSYFRDSKPFPYCGLFETAGDLRLNDDLLFPLEKSLEFLLPGLSGEDLPEQLKAKSQQSISAFLYEGRDPLDLRGYGFSVSQDNFLNLAEKRFVTDGFLKSCARLFDHISCDLGRVYWSLGTQIGRIMRILKDSDVVWGSFFDPREKCFHWNAHSNNFLFTPSVCDYPQLSPLDFDLAFTRETFLEERGLPSFDELVRTEKWLLLQDLAEGQNPDAPSGEFQVAKLDEPFATLRKGLRETLVSGVNHGFENNESEQLSSEMIALLMLSSYCF